MYMLTNNERKKDMEDQFEAWWKLQIERNGGVEIGADYRHWAKAAWEACDKGLVEMQDSGTAEIEMWKNPLLSKADRLCIADGAIAFRDKIIRNLRNQLKEMQVAK